MDDGITIRPLAREDLPGIVRLHEEALPKDFITSLGTSFLADVFYGSIVDRPEGVGHVAISGEGLQGYVVGAHPADVWYASLKRRHLGAFVRGALASLADGPEALLGLGEVALGMVRGSGEPEDYPADLGYIAVAPQARGAGLGRRLVRAHLDALAGRGARGCWTKTYETNASARRMYEACGFRYLGKKRLRGIASAYYGVLLSPPVIQSPAAREGAG
jgi:ribosomal protein S18 acetylase RimI-like enzyme